MENAQALRGAIAAALNVLVDFMTEADNQGLLPAGGAEARTQLAKQLAQFDRFVDERMKKITQRLESHQPFECPACLQEAAKICTGLECEFCHTHTEPGASADHYVERTLNLSQYQTIKDGGTWPVFGCPDCGEDALVELDEPSAERGFLCFGCAEEWAADALQPCYRCGRMVRSDGMAMCNDCFSDRMSRD